MSRGIYNQKKQTREERLRLKREHAKKKYRENAEYRKKNKENYYRWIKENPEESKIIFKRYYEKNKEKIIARQLMKYHDKKKHK